MPFQPSHLALFALIEAGSDRCDWVEASDAAEATQVDRDANAGRFEVSYVFRTEKVADPLMATAFSSIAVSIRIIDRFQNFQDGAMVVALDKIFHTEHRRLDADELASACRAVVLADNAASDERLAVALAIQNKWYRVKA